MRERLTAGVAALLLAGLVVGGLPCARSAAAPTGSDRIGIRLLPTPDDRAGAPRSEAYLVDHVAPGTTVTRQVQVTNATGGELAISTYAGAAAVEGDRFVPAPAAVESEITQWTTVTPAALPLEAGAAGVATVTIAVPGDAPAGERYGVVWAQPPPGQAGGATTVNRVGVRIYLSVGAGAPRATDLVGAPEVAGSGFPWLLVVIPAAAVVLGAAGTRATRRRGR